MNKTDIIKEISRHVIDPKEAELVVELTFELIKKALSGGEKVMICNFGTFRKCIRKAGKARNPKTGESMIIAKRQMITFRPSRQLREKLNA